MTRLIFLSLLPLVVCQSIRDAGVALENRAGYKNRIGSRSNSYHGSASSYGRPSISAFVVQQASPDAGSGPAPVEILNLGDECSEGQRCSTPNSGCVDGVCQCIDDTINVNLANVLCVPKAAYLGDACLVTEQCRPHLDPSAACYEDICLCEPFFHVAIIRVMEGEMEDGTRHPTGIMRPNRQQQNMLETEQVCVLKKKLFQSCQDNLECSTKVWQAECRDNQCVCKSGYVNIGNQMCVSEAPALGSECSVDVQCRGIPNSECRQGVCSCRSNYVHSHNDLQRRSSIIGHLFRNVGANEYDGKYTQYVRRQGRAGGECLPLADLGQECRVDVQCSERTANSACISNQCECASNWIQASEGVNVCLPRLDLGDIGCILTEQCDNNDGACCEQKTSQCVCNQTSCMEGNPPQCFPNRLVGEECEVKCQCESAGAYCQPPATYPGVNTCQCPSGKIEINGTCEDATLLFSRQRWVVTDQLCCFPMVMDRVITNLAVDASSTETNFEFRFADGVAEAVTNNYTINPNNGNLLLKRNIDLTHSPSETLSFNVVVMSTNLDTLIDEAEVVVITDPCCSMVPEVNSLLFNTVIVLGDRDGDGNMTCDGDDFWGDALLNLDNAFVQICKETPTIVGVPTVSEPCEIMMADPIAGTANEVRLPDSFVYDSATVADQTVCTVNVVAEGCNGLRSDITMALNLFFTHCEQTP